MKTIKKETIMYVATDGKIFSSLKKCQKWEEHITLDLFHKALLKCNFHSRCNIEPYYHNREIEYIGTKYTQDYLDENNSYLLMGGVMGNGDDRVRYKIKGSKIKLLRYSTDTNEQIYLCTIPYRWVQLPYEDLKIVVDEYIENRNTSIDYMKNKLIDPEHIGDGLYMTDTGYAVEIAVNHHENSVAVIDMYDIDKAITYLERVKKRIENNK